MTAQADRTRRPFVMEEGIAILSRTPATLDAMLRGLPAAWIAANEGDDTWSPFDVLGHLIHADRTNWIPRIRIVLAHGEARVFDEFDRFAQLETSRGKTLDDLLVEFSGVRQASVSELRSLHLTDLEQRGRHPGLGTVTLRQLLAAWVTHDLDHLFQVSRVLARQYADEVGPYRRYLRIVREAPTQSG